MRYRTLRSLDPQRYIDLYRSVIAHHTSKESFTDAFDRAVDALTEEGE